MSLSGRPTLYTAETATLILARLADGESLRAICCSDESLPAESTVRLWAVDDRRGDDETEGFAIRYARARDVGLDARADELLDIASTPRVGSKRTLDKDGKLLETVEADMIEHRRLQIDTGKWYLSKLAPKRYGAHLELNNNHGVQDSLGELLKQIDGQSRSLPRRPVE